MVSKALLNMKLHRIANHGGLRLKSLKRIALIIWDQVGHIELDRRGKFS